MDVFISPSELLGRAEELRAHQKPSNIRRRYILLWHTIELILRAYIASHRRITADELRKLFGHDLTNLLDEAIRLGLSISPSAESGIEKLTERHREYLTYPNETAYRMLVSEYFVERDIDELFKAVREKIAG
jgi:hypothetical protein